MMTDLLERKATKSKTKQGISQRDFFGQSFATTDLNQPPDLAFLSPQMVADTPEQMPPAKISIRDLNFYYGDFKALKNINLDIPEKKVTAFIGPSGCGK